MRRHSRSNPNRHGNSDRHTDNNADRHTNNNADRHTNRNANDHTNRNANDHTNRDANDHTNRDANDHTNRDANDHTDRDANDHTNRDADDHTNRDADDHTNINDNSYIDPDTERHGHSHPNTVADADNRANRCDGNTDANGDGVGNLVTDSVRDRDTLAIANDNGDDPRDYPCPDEHHHDQPYRNRNRHPGGHRHN